MFTPQEAAVIAEVPLATVQKALTTKQLPNGSRDGVKRLLDQRSVLALALTRVKPANVRLSPSEARKRLLGADLAQPLSLESGGALDLAKLLAPSRRRMGLVIRGRGLVEGRSGRRAATVKGTTIVLSDLLASIQLGETANGIAADFPALDGDALEAITLWAAANPPRGRPPRKDATRTGLTALHSSGWHRSPRISAAQISAWAGSRQAQGDLPILIRKLLHASAAPAAASIPGGDSIHAPGWDGIADVTVGTAWVPAGRTAWELSCRADPGTKAVEDYEKRTAGTSPGEQRRTTFMLVTARRWPGKDRWLTGRRDGWQAMRAYDADDLEQWLEQVPAVALWFANLLGLTGHGVESVDAFWAGWAAQSRFSITPDAIFAGRRERCEKLVAMVQKCLEDKAGEVLGVMADSTGEAAAFAAASLLLHPDLSGASVAVTTAVGWQFVEQNPLIRVAIAASPEIAERPTRRPGLVVLIPFAAGDMKDQYRGVAARNDAIEVKLDRPDALSFERALAAIGVDASEARRLAWSTGRSWSVFRRHTAHNPAVREPGWLTNAHAQALATICLLSSWSSDKQADRDVVSRVAGREYSAVETDLSWLACLDDAPVVQIGPVWKAKSSLELIDLFGSRIAGEELERFFQITGELLTEPDPVLELPEEQRYAASIHGKVRPHSGLLRSAICDTLVKLAVRGPSTSLSRLHIEQRVEAFVHSLLLAADGTRWLSLATSLPALAEAAPMAFLKAVSASLGMPDAPVKRLLTETSGSSFTGRCWHAGLLWSLEVLAWAPERLTRVSLILAELASVEIKGNWSNSPLNSLTNILRSWLPQTAAPLDLRIKALDAVIGKTPIVAFDLLDRLAVAGPDFSAGTSRPVWRDDDAGAGHGVTDNEVYGILSAVIVRQIDQARGHVERLSKLIAKLDNLTVDHVARVMTSAKEFSGASHTDEERAALRDAVRNRVHFCKNFADKRRDGFQELPELERLYLALTPKDIILRHCWLFAGHWLQLPQRDREDEFAGRAGRVASVRDKAIREIRAAEGLAGVRRLVGAVIEQAEVGAALGRTRLGAAELIGWLMAEAGTLMPDDPMRGVARGLFCGPDLDRSRALLQRAVEAARKAGWDDAKLARLLTTGREEKFTWKLVSDCGESADRAYWEQCSPGFWLRDESDAYDIALRRLIAANRPRSALQLCRLDVKTTDPHLVFKMLEELLKGGESHVPLGSWEVHEAVNALEASGAMEKLSLARLEFGLMPVLGLQGYERAISLFEIVTTDPVIFTELITTLYRAANTPADPMVDGQKTAADNAWHVLHNCRRIPGTQPDRTVHPQTFLDFVEKARTLCNKAGRGTPCDVTLGEMLAYAPADPDGIWPCGPVRDLLDRPDLDDMRRGFMTGMFNKRGSFMKTLTEGGLQERALAEGFRSHARALHHSHVHLAATLDELAGSYDRDGLREDVQARLRADGH